MTLIKVKEKLYSELNIDPAKIKLRISHLLKT